MRKMTHFCKRFWAFFLSLVLLFGMIFSNDLTLGANATEIVDIVEEENDTSFVEDIVKEESIDEEETEEFIEEDEITENLEPEVFLDEQPNISDVSTNDIDESKKDLKANDYPTFEKYEIIDGMRITVSAEEGVFPEDATLYVEKVLLENYCMANEALDEERENDVKVAIQYTFDIKVLDNAGNELEPEDESLVRVSFTMEEVLNINLDVNVWHITDYEEMPIDDEVITVDSAGNDTDPLLFNSATNTNLPSVEKLEVIVAGDTAVVDSDGFSLYTVEFTYNNHIYVLQGDEEIALNVILETVGLSGQCSDVAISNESFFTAYLNESGEWMIKSKSAFWTNEWIKVTINDVIYEIVVTDSPSENLDNRVIASFGSDVIAWPDRINGGGWSYVFYGKWDTNGDGIAEPILYRVLDPRSYDFGVDGGSVLLDCDSIIGYDNFFLLTENGSGYYAKSYQDCRLNTYFLNDIFYNNGFTPSEKRAIASSTKTRKPVWDLDGYYKNNENDRDALRDKTYIYRFEKLYDRHIFLLAAEEMTNSHYGYRTVQSRVKTGGKYWLRSIISYTYEPIIGMKNNPGVVDPTDYGSSIHGLSFRSDAGISPALNIEKKKILFTELLNGEANEPGAFYKFSIISDSFGLTHDSITVSNNRTVNIKVRSKWNTDEGNINRISVLMLDNDYAPGNANQANIMYYGETQSTVTGGAYLENNGIEWLYDVSFDIPENYDPSWRTYLVSEQLNDYFSTDYASYPDQINIPYYDVSIHPTAKSGLIADGNDQILIRAGWSKTGIEYMLGNDSKHSPSPDDNRWSTNLPVGRENGIYYVWYKAGISGTEVETGGTGIFPIRCIIVTFDGSTDLSVNSIGNPDPVNGGGWSYVYYGKKNLVRHNRYRVLDNNAEEYGIEGNSLLLESDMLLSSISSDNLNGLFLSEYNLSEIEKNAIGESKKENLSINDCNPSSLGYKFAPLSGEKAFSLDIAEAFNSSYGYVKAEDRRRKLDMAGIDSNWKLRSESISTGEKAIWTKDGELVDSGVSGAISAAINIKLKDILFSTPVKGAAGEPGTEYKLTLVDPNIEIKITEGENISSENRIVTIPYSITGNHKTEVTDVYVMLVDGNYREKNEDNATLKYLLRLDGDLALDGIGSFDLPYDYSSTWNTYIIAVDVNSNEESDYSSNPIKINLPVSVASISLAPRAKTDLKANGLSQELVYPGLADTGVEYSLGKDSVNVPSEGWSDDIPTGICGGKYYVWYRAKSSASRICSSASCVIVSISGSTTTIAGLGASIIEKPDSINGGGFSYVYYGKYDIGDLGNLKPIAFRVLDNNSPFYGVESNSLLLDCDSVLTLKAFHSNLPEWNNSDLRVYLNGKEDGQFLSSEHFSKEEVNAISNSYTAPAIYIRPSDYMKTRINPLGGKVFILDQWDLEESAYGYVFPVNRIKLFIDNPCNYWTGSSFMQIGIGGNALDVYAERIATTSGDISYAAVCNTEIGVSPAINIALKNILFTRLISGKAGEMGAEYKLTVLDRELQLNPSDIFIDHDTITFDYTAEGFDSSKSSYAPSILILDDYYTEGNVNNASIKYYEKLDKQTQNSDTISFKIPDNFDPNWKVYLIAETDNDTYRTDYSSVPSLIEISLSTCEVKPRAIPGLVADGYYHDLVTSGISVSGIEFSLGIDNKNAPTTGWNDSIPKGKDAGKYYIWYRAKNDGSRISIKGVVENEITGSPKLGMGDMFETDPYNAGKFSFVYFGNYNNKSIKYRVLDKENDSFTGDKSVLLDCDDNLLTILIGNNDSWSENNIRSWLNGRSSGSLLNTKFFSIAELDAMLPAYKTHPSVSDAEPALSENFAPLNGEYLFLLDEAEIRNPLYGYGSEKGRKKASAIWLRSRDNEGYYLKLEPSGYVSSSKTSSSTSAGLSPAMNIKESAVLLSTLVKGSWNEPNAEYKLTLIDDKISLTVRNDSKINVRGNCVDVPYSIIGDNRDLVTNISVIMLDKEYGSEDAKLMYYKQFAKVYSPSGSGTFVIPSVYDPNWKTYIIAEDVNEGTYSNSASVPIEINMSVLAATVLKAPEAKNGLISNGKGHELVTPGEADTTMEYALGVNTSTAPIAGYDEDIPVGINGGTYYVWYRASGDNNHLSSTPECVVVNIGGTSSPVVGLGTSVISNPDSENGSGFSYVYYGHFDSDRNNTYEPVLYRVLANNTDKYAVDGNSILLDCDTILKLTKLGEYNNLSSSRWGGSEIKQWLNDQNAEGFLNDKNFTDIERNAIKPSFDSNYVDGSMDFVALSGEKAFALNGCDLQNADYGYVYAQDRWKTYFSDRWEYWTRSAGSKDVDPSVVVILSEPERHYMVSSLGQFDAVYITQDKTGISPALNVGLKDILFTKLVSGYPGERGTSYKFTLLDSEIGLDVSSERKETLVSDIITVPYDLSGSDSFKVKDISVMILDGDYVAGNPDAVELKHIIRLNGIYDQSGNVKQSGSGSFALPEDYDTSWKLYLVAQTENDATETDYASVPLMIKRPNTMKINSDAQVEAGGKSLDLSKNVTACAGTLSYMIESDTAGGCKIDSLTGELISGEKEGQCIVKVIASGDDECFEKSERITVNVGKKLVVSNPEESHTENKEDTEVKDSKGNESINGNLSDNKSDKALSVNENNGNIDKADNANLSGKNAEGSQETDTTNNSIVEGIDGSTVALNSELENSAENGNLFGNALITEAGADDSPELFNPEESGSKGTDQKNVNNIKSESGQSEDDLNTSINEVKGFDRSGVLPGVIGGMIAIGLITAAGLIFYKKKIG